MTKYLEQGHLHESVKQEAVCNHENKRLKQQVLSWIARKHWGWLGGAINLNTCSSDPFIPQGPILEWWPTTSPNCTTISAGGPSVHTWAHRATFYSNPDTVQAHISGSVAEWGPFFLLIFSMIAKFQEKSHMWKFIIVYCILFTLPGNMGL